MPGIVLCNRRWAIGSDDILIPAIILCICHLPSAIWLIVTIAYIDYNPTISCSLSMYEFLIGYLILLLMILIVEFIAFIVSCRGTIMDTKPRKFLEHIIYARLVLLLVELCFIIAGIVILVKYKTKCRTEWYDVRMRNTILSILIGTGVFIIIMLLSINCVYDRAGKSFYRLQIFEKHYRKDPNKVLDTIRNLMHRRTLDLYHKNWKQRCTLLCCCIKKQENQAAFSVISDTLSCFFHKYDIVPSDILAGLLLLSQKQKLNRINVLTQVYLGIDDFMSGVPVTCLTRFINLNDPKELDVYKQLIYFYNYAIASYGWPLYAYTGQCALLKLLPNIRHCFCLNKIINCLPDRFRRSGCCSNDVYDVEIRDDNCCFCYYDGLKKQLPYIPTSNKKNKNHIVIIYASFYSDVEKTPFFVAVDYYYKKVVISIRGTESLQDLVTDMQINQVPLPGIDAEKQWFAHQGMTNAAFYIKSEIESKNLLERAFNYNLERKTNEYDLLIVGHSLGGGTGAILSILLKDQYPNVKCFTYSPPGALLSESCMNETKSFITTVVVGKDMVPRLGMPQMEKLRNDIMEVLHKSKKSKWQIISGLCCTNKTHDDQLNDRYAKISNLDNTDYSTQVEYACLNSPLPQVSKDRPPLYPPGRIIHIVRKYPREPSNADNLLQNDKITDQKATCSPIYQIIEANNHGFDELLISPRMLQDHIPHNVLGAMKKALKDQNIEENQTKNTENDNFLNINEIKADKICDLQPINQSNNKYSFIKKHFYRQTAKQHEDKTSKEINRELFKEFNRNSKTVSVCSYENIKFAPLARPESMSDITIGEDVIIDNNFRESILKLRDEEDNEDDVQNSERSKELKWWNNDINNSDGVIKSNDTNCNKLLLATSTPRTENVQTLELSNSMTTNSNNHLVVVNGNNSDFTQELSSTSLSLFNPELKLESSSLCSSLIYNNSINQSSLNNAESIDPKDENFSFSLLSNSNSNNESKNNSNIATNNYNPTTSMTSGDIDFTSIEKLDLIKPQSKDYILCFDTSIDSSIHSNKAADTSKTENKNEFDIDSGIVDSRPT